MKRNILIAILLLSTFNFMSCDDGAAESPSTCLITRFGSGGDRVDLIYNPNLATQLDSIVYYESGDIIRVKRLSYEDGNLSSLVDDDQEFGKSEERFVYDADDRPFIIKFYGTGIADTTAYDSLVYNSAGQITTEFLIDPDENLKQKHVYTYSGGNISQIDLFYTNNTSTTPDRTLTYQYDTDIKEVSDDFATLFALYQAGDYLVPQLFSENSRTIREDVYSNPSFTQSDTIWYTANDLGYPITFKTSSTGTPAGIFYENCQ